MEMRRRLINFVSAAATLAGSSAITLPAMAGGQGDYGKPMPPQPTQTWNQGGYAEGGQGGSGVGVGKANSQSDAYSGSNLKTGNIGSTSGAAAVNGPNTVTGTNTVNGGPSSAQAGGGTGQANNSMTNTTNYRAAANGVPVIGSQLPSAVGLAPCTHMNAWVGPSIGVGTIGVTAGASVGGAMHVDPVDGCQDKLNKTNVTIAKVGALGNVAAQGTCEMKASAVWALAEGALGDNKEAYVASVCKEAKVVIVHRSAPPKPHCNPCCPATNVNVNVTGIAATVARSCPTPQ